MNDQRTVTDGEVGVSHGKGVAHKLPQIFHAGLSRIAVGVEMVTHGEQHGSGTGVAAVFPHALGHAVDGALNAHHRVEIARRGSQIHLVGIHPYALPTQSLQQGGTYARNALIEDAVLATLQIPQEPMLLRLYGFVQKKVETQSSAYLADAFLTQSLGEHAKIGCLDVGVETPAQTDVAMQHAVVRHPSAGEYGGAVAEIGAQQAQSCNARNEFQCGGGRLSQCVIDGIHQPAGGEVVHRQSLNAFHSLRMGKTLQARHQCRVNLNLRGRRVLPVPFAARRQQGNDQQTQISQS